MQPGGPVSIVVPTRDRPPMLDECLLRIDESKGAEDEVIVVDSASHSPEVRKVAEAHGARYLRCDRPGASRARNAGWRAATYPVVAFVDDDVRVAPGWVDAWRHSFAEHPEVGFMTGRIGVPPGQSEQRPVAVTYELDPFLIDRDTRGLLGHSASMAARRDALEKVGGFDERMGPGSNLRNTEDLDLFDRFIGAGILGRYEPSAEAWHDQWRDRLALLKLDYNYGYGMGARVVKLMKINRSRARHVARVVFWEWGLREVITYGRRRRNFLTATAAVRVLGAVLGFLRSLPIPVYDGHFAPAPLTDYPLPEPAEVEEGPPRR